MGFERPPLGMKSAQTQDIRQPGMQRRQRGRTVQRCSPRQPLRAPVTGSRQSQFKRFCDHGIGNKTQRQHTVCCDVPEKRQCQMQIFSRW